MGDITTSTAIQTFMSATTKADMGDALGDACTINTLAALIIDTSKRINSKSISADTTFTFSGAPAAGSAFSLLVTNTDIDFGHKLTLPSSFSLTRWKTVTTVTVPLGSTLQLNWRYDGTTYYLKGESPLMGGAGAADTYSVAIGKNAAADNAPSLSVNVGYQAGKSAPADGQMVNVGYNAGASAGGYAQTNVGYVAGASCAGASSVNIGYAAGQDSGGTNVCIGTHAGEACTNVTGGSTFIGYHAGGAAVGASNSVFIGDHAAHGVAANNSIFLGPFSGIDRPATLWIDGRGTVFGGTTPLIYGEFDNSYLKINGHLEATAGVKFPSADPHIAGYWWDNSGVLTKSAG